MHTCSLNFNLQKGGEYGNASFRVGKFSLQGLGEASKQDITSGALNHPTTPLISVSPVRLL